MAKGVLAGQKKFIKDPAATGEDTLWGSMKASLGFLADPKKNKAIDRQQAQLVSIGAITPGALKAEIDSSVKITAMEIA